MTSDRRCRRVGSRCKAGLASIARRRCKRSLVAERGMAPNTARMQQSLPLHKDNMIIHCNEHSVQGTPRDADVLRQ